MRDTYLRLVDIEPLFEAQEIQLGLPLKDGGCGLRSQPAELRRLFVSSSMLIAPAVHAAIGQRIGAVADPDDFLPKI